MPIPDGKITFRLDENEAQVMFWALINRVRQCSDERRAATSTSVQAQLETEIIQLGSLLEKLPMHIGINRPRKSDDD